MKQVVCAGLMILGSMNSACAAQEGVGDGGGSMKLQFASTGNDASLSIPFFGDDGNT